MSTELSDWRKAINAKVMKPKVTKRYTKPLRDQILKVADDLFTETEFMSRGSIPSLQVRCSENDPLPLLSI